MSLSFSQLFSSEKKEDTAEKASRVVGIDVGSSSVKVVELFKDEKGIKLSTYGELQLGPYAGTEMGKPTYLSEQKLTQALIDVIREAKVQSRTAVYAVSLASSFVTVVRSTARDDRELKKAIPVEARKYIPVPLTEVELNWFTLDTKHGKDRGRDVFLAAIHQKSLARVRGALNTLQMDKSPLEIELFSAVRSSVDAAVPCAAVIDIGASSTKLYIVQNGLIRKIFTVKIGGSALTALYAEGSEETFAAAEDFKRTYGIGDAVPKPAQEAAIAHLDKVYHEIERVIRTFSTTKEISVDGIVLCGGGAALVGLETYVQKRLGLPVYLARPFGKVMTPTFMAETLQEIGPSFSVAVGAALRGFE